MVVDFVEIVVFVEVVGGLVGSVYFEEVFVSLVVGCFVYQVFEQVQIEVMFLVFGFYCDIQQVCFVEDDLDDVMVDLLVIFEYQLVMVVFQVFVEDVMGLGVVEGGIFDFQYGIEVCFGYWVEGNCIVY